MLTATNKNVNLSLGNILTEIRRNLYRNLVVLKLRLLFVEFAGFFPLTTEDSICSLVYFSRTYIFKALWCKALLCGLKRECAKVQIKST